MPEPPPPTAFFPDHLAALPPPARRYLTHALAPGVRPPRALRLRMRGRIRAGRWLPFRARQVLNADRGFVWRAAVAGGLLHVTDCYTRGAAQTRVDALGLLPVARDSDDDVVRSALGRAVAERVWLPGALLPGPDVAWSAADEARAVATVRVHGATVPLTLDVADDGALRSVTLPRWGPTGDGSHAELPFGMVVEAERTFHGVTVPARGRVGWWPGTDRWTEGEFFRFTIDAVEFPRRPDPGHR